MEHCSAVGKALRSFVQVEWTIYDAWTYTHVCMLLSSQCPFFSYSSAVSSWECSECLHKLLVFVPFFSLLRLNIVCDKVNLQQMLSEKRRSMENKMLELDLCSSMAAANVINGNCIVFGSNWLIDRNAVGFIIRYGDLNFSTAQMIWWLSINVNKCKKKKNSLAKILFLFISVHVSICNMISTGWSHKNCVFKHTISNGFHGICFFVVVAFVAGIHKCPFFSLLQTIAKNSCKAQKKNCEPVNYLHKYYGYSNANCQFDVCVCVRESFGRKLIKWRFIRIQNDIYFVVFLFLLFHSNLI